MHACLKLIKLFFLSINHVPFNEMNVPEHITQQKHIIGPTPLASNWHPIGTSVVSHWHPMGIPVASHWNLTDIPLASHWHSTGTSLAFHWHPMGIPLAPNWNLTDIPWASHWHLPGISLASRAPPKSQKSFGKNPNLTGKVSVHHVWFGLWAFRAAACQGELWKAPRKPGDAAKPRKVMPQGRRRGIRSGTRSPWQLWGCSFARTKLRL